LCTEDGGGRFLFFEVLNERMLKQFGFIPYTFQYLFLPLFDSCLPFSSLLIYTFIPFLSLLYSSILIHTLSIHICSSLIPFFLSAVLQIPVHSSSLEVQ
jgi:hypothetical protein